ncbi:MAG: DNA-directed RNA polymerase subunit beta [Candidatus Shikimatogenerans bostrichidophilus]|nr:MAG: DNA-directed RNA polymerase subunit beta [Candidatus Shikimatogenerans bostrichidophilus]
MINKRIDFSKLSKNIIYFDFLKGQINSYRKFLSINRINNKNDILFKILKKFFPIKNKLNKFKIDFLNYYALPPKYNIEESIENEISYGTNINIKLKLTYYIKNIKIIKYRMYYLCTCPFITNNGSFIINGNERTIIYQFNRSPGIFFGENYDYNGNKIYYIRIIPVLGVWLEFLIDNNNIIYTYIDKKKKVLALTFLRALGLKNDNDFYEIFDLYEKVNLKKIKLKLLIGRKNVYNILNNSKKIILKKNTLLNKDNINILIKNNILYLYLYNKNFNILRYRILKKNIKKNDSKKYNVCNIYIYKLFRRTIPPNLSVAKNFISRIFFNKKYYDLGDIGRYKLNLKLNINNKFNISYLTKEDYKKILKNLIKLFNNPKEIDDIDNLSNRQVKMISDHLSSIFSLGLYRIKNSIKNKSYINLYDTYNQERLINSRILNSLINTFFATSQVSQFLDKTNPLSEITHKRRITLLGPGGLTKSRASFEARDVNDSHYGRLCPIETPEGPNIGLIYSLALFSNINKFGFLETPYRKIINGVINNKLYFLTSEEEKDINIGLHNIYKNNKKNKKFLVRRNNKIIYKNIKYINYIDYSPNQILSISASLIPFLEHNDANRALMGSNMMRQSIPLLFPDEPIVGTGMEDKIIYYSRNYRNAKTNGIVKYVDSKNIIIKYNYNKFKKNTNFYNKYYTYKLPKFKRTNQNTCFNLNPIVKKGDKVKKNQILSEGFASKNGYLSLGKNILVAFMSWKGYNYEDSIVISNKVLEKDMFTSLHIEIFNSNLKKIKYGREEFTRNLPNINKYKLRNLDKNGIIKVGSKVRPGDILIGKIKPKNKKIITPEEKLLKYIFGDKASNVKDISLRAPKYLNGIVYKVKIYKYKNIRYKKDIYKNEYKYKKRIKKFYNSLVIKIYKILKNNIINKDIYIPIIIKNKVKYLYYKKNNYINIKIIAYLLKLRKLFDYIIMDKKTKNNIKILFNNFNIYFQINKDRYINKRLKFFLGHPLLNNNIKKVKIYIIQKRILKVGDKMSGRHGNKGVIAKIVKKENMPFLEDGTTIDMILNPLSVPSRMNLGQVLEAILGYIGYKNNKKFNTPIFDGCTIKDLHNLLKKNKIKNFGRVNLYDGITGEKYINKVTIGVLYMLKLGHMVDDKIHTRSTGPYSLITQQPLGGKSQLGGQRLGEMEVWALQAFGASNLLRELLTIKSDDIKGRYNTYESIIKGKKIPNPNIPESFNVLIKELKGLCLNIKIKKNDK